MIHVIPQSPAGRHPSKLSSYFLIWGVSAVLKPIIMEPRPRNPGEVRLRACVLVTTPGHNCHGKQG